MQQPMREKYLCLVTGAEGALGREAVVGLRAHHFTVAASCRTERDKNALEEFLAAQNLTGVKVFVCDLSNEDSVVKLIQAIEKRSGNELPLGYVLNAAGGFRWVTTTQSTADDFDFLINANVRSSWLLTKHCIPLFMQRNFGRMIVVSAHGTLGLGDVGMGLYLASKAALNALVRCIAQEVKPNNININALLPSIIDTPSNRRDMPDRDPRTWVQPSSLVRLAAMLFNETGDQVNGDLFSVTGRV